MVERLKSAGISADGVPTVRFVEPSSWADVDEALGALDTFDWVVFTSPKGVAAVSARMVKLGVGLPPKAPHVAAVGSATAEAARGAGFPVDHVPVKYQTSALAESLPAGPGSSVVLFRTDIGDKMLPTVLERRGLKVKDLTVYETKPVEGKIDGGSIADARIVIFASPSEVRGLKERTRPEDFDLLVKRAVAACIGPVTAGAARDAGFLRVTASAESSVEALIETVQGVFQHA